MSALTSLLARDHVVPVRKIEEALQRQVIAGGDIETVLLELELVEEDVLSAYRAALYGLLPATRDEVMRASREAVRALSPELAARVRLIPLSLEGRTLVGAVSSPLPEALERELRERVGCDLIQRVCTEVRVAAGLCHHYGFDLEPRLRKLSERLRKRDPGVIPYVRPPEGQPGASSRPPSGGDTKPLAPEFERKPPPSESGYPRPTPPALSTTPAPAGLGKLSEPPGSAADVGRPSAQGPFPQPAPLPSGAEASGSLVPGGVTNEVARALRGPVDLARAKALLERCASRDDVLYVTMRYARQFFDFVALFVVRREGALGRMSDGGGLTRELIQQVQFPLEGSGVFARAVRDRRALVGDLSAAESEQSAAAVLGRPSGSPGVVLPMVLGPRVVLALYADREGEAIGADDIEPLQDVMPAVVTAIRRLILEKKALSHVGPLPTSPAPSGAAPSAEPGATRPPYPVAPDGPSAAPSAAPRRPEPGRAGSVAPTFPHIETAKMVAPLSTSPPTAEEVAPPASPPSAEEEALARGRVLGVPRSAPPPPLRESMPPERHLEDDGTYSIHRSGASARPVRRAAGADRQEAQPAAALDAAEAAPTQRQPEQLTGTDGIAVSVAPAEAPRVTNAPVVAGPSVIIDMGDNVAELVDALASCGPTEEPPALAALLQLGEAALPELLQRFPGPLWFDRQLPHKVVPRGSELSAIARAIVAFGDVAAPYVASKISNSQGDDCFYALMVAGEIPHPDLIDCVARRLFDGDEGIRQLAVDVLKRFRALPQFQIVMDALAQLSARSGKDPQRQLLAVRVLGELRDERALDALFERLGDPRPEIVRSAHQALTLLTCQDFGEDLRGWRAWRAQWGERHRAEWLMEALLHSDEAVRGRAGDELKQLTQQYFGFHPALPKRDREVAQRKYREWWEREGRHVFASAAT